MKTGSIRGAGWLPSRGTAAYTYVKHSNRFQPIDSIQGIGMADATQTL